MGAITEQRLHCNMAKNSKRQQLVEHKQLQHKKTVWLDSNDS